MNFFNYVPIETIQCMVANAIMQGLASPTKTTPIDTTPYQLYLMSQQQQQLSNGVNMNTSILPNRPGMAPNRIMPNNFCPPLPNNWQNNNIQY